MDNRGVINRFFLILLNPVLGWVKYNPEDVRFRDLFSPFFIITLLVLFISRLVGKTLSYLSVTDFYDILMYSAVSVIIDLLFFLIVIFAVNLLMPYFKLTKSKAKIALLIYVSLIPFYIGVILINLFPSLFFLALIALYTFYVLYWGVVYFLKPARASVNVFFTIITLLMIGTYMILNFAMVYPFFDFIF
jgi:hypothetical protein